jgi:hypothetical protein
VELTLILNFFAGQAAAAAIECRLRWKLLSATNKPRLAMSAYGSIVLQNTR